MIGRTLWESAVALQEFLEFSGYPFCCIAGVAYQRWGQPRTTVGRAATILTKLPIWTVHRFSTSSARWLSLRMSPRFTSGRRKCFPDERRRQRILGVGRHTNSVRPRVFKTGGGATRVFIPGRDEDTVVRAGGWAGTLARRASRS